MVAQRRQSLTSLGSFSPPGSGDVANILLSSCYRCCGGWVLCQRVGVVVVLVMLGISDLRSQAWTSHGGGWSEESRMTRFV